MQTHFIICPMLYNMAMGKIQSTSPSRATQAYRVALISVSIALSLLTLVYHTMFCLLPSFCCYSLHLPTEEWPGWVDLGGWLNTKMVRTGIEAATSLIQLLTRRDLEQVRWLRDQRLPPSQPNNTCYIGRKPKAGVRFHMPGTYFLKMCGSQHL